MQENNISNNNYSIKPIARIYTDYNEKFGIPRQPGLVDSLYGEIVFEPEFRDENAIRCIEEFNYLWLIWGFSKNQINMEEDSVKWSPLVTPPRLGGKRQVGVFASRSPYRPNSLGLSSVKLIKVESNSREKGSTLIVSGADIMNGTPIYDIKPYIPYSDCHEDAKSGYSVSKSELLNVVFPEELLEGIPPEKREGLIQILAQDPRGAYEKEPDYLYGLSFNHFDIKFQVERDTLTVFKVEDSSSGINYIKNSKLL